MQILLLVARLFVLNFYNIAIAAEDVSLQDLVEQIESMKAQLSKNEEKMQAMEEELKTYRSVIPSPDVTVAEVEAEGPLPSEKKERLEKRIERLEDLSGKMFLLEPVEEIKKVREWVCPDGHIYDHPGPDGTCHICGKPQKERLAFRKFKYARKESVSDLIEGMMEEEFKKRVAVGLSTTGVVQQTANSPKGKHDNTSAEGSFDLFFLHRPMMNSILFVNLESIGGSGPDIFSGSPNNLNDDVSRGSHQDEDGLDRVSVREVWLQSTLMQDRLRLVAGKIDLTNYFDMNEAANDETTQFLMSAFVNNLALSPPDNAPGLVGYFDSKRGYGFGLGLQSNDNSGRAVTDKLYGIAEVDYYAPKFLFGLGGNYRLWGRYNGDTRSRAVGLSFDQQLTQRLTAFSRFGITGNTAPDEVEWAWSLGLGMRSPFLSRRYDHTGLAFSQLKMPDGKKEDVAETYYSFFITDHLNVSLNSQVIFNSVKGPDDPRDSDYLATFGLRVQMDF